ncbi:MAG: hypothetical protein Q7S84_00865 [bacterium]|nr:hypothetical protein [bacterium]
MTYIGVIIFVALAVLFFRRMLPEKSYRWTMVAAFAVLALTATFAKEDATFSFSISCIFGMLFGFFVSRKRWRRREETRV